ncbi:hypothetical protein HMPREF1544_10921 [Mucor circinelloides 1006PhL]|uniref:Uncharacterized protein n=1 Tax=Mucor circinelloides f. circinelloides (strain 1006PhL) TaxID=1220926 RepID=S2IX60_MUCC1|nr:hypothetical protein HMPREF1544_10921 [Mucor circinelloides 1006PhL]
MKLKKRQKRVSDDIRQEDYKPDLILINTSSSTANELNTWSRDIQQGDTKNAYKFEEKDYYHCYSIASQPTTASLERNQ